jgi:hypothetical protein
MLDHVAIVGRGAIVGERIELASAHRQKSNGGKVGIAMKENENLVRVVHAAPYEFGDAGGGIEARYLSAGE